MKNSRRVVVTGLGVVAPNGIGKDTFWQNLVAGKSAIDYITAFDPTPYPCHVAGEVRDFDPKDFSTSRKAKMMGRFSQFAVAATRLAFDDAHFKMTPDRAPRTSVFYGTSVNGGGDVAANALETIWREGVSAINPWAALEYPPHATSSYVAIEFGITGPALSVSSNCCTGIDAINEGFSRIREGTSTVAVVGACDAPIFPLAFGAFCALGALSTRNDAPRKASRPYDKLRDGIVISEGAATLILEELDFARDRGAPIYAEVLGHGSASEAIGNHAYRIPITSIKSMIGQPISAAGTIQAAAACLSIRDQVVPPTINQE